MSEGIYFCLSIGNIWKNIHVIFEGQEAYVTSVKTLKLLNYGCGIGRVPETDKIE